MAHILQVVRGRNSSFPVDLAGALCYSPTESRSDRIRINPFSLKLSMSAVTKGLRRSTSRGTAHRAKPKSAAKSRSSSFTTKRPKATRAVKAAVRKTVKSKSVPKRKPASKAAARKPTPVKRSAPKKPVVRKAVARKTVAAKKSLNIRVKKTQKVAAVRAQRPVHVAVAPPPRQPTVDESAAMKAFERAHKEFTRGRFGEARSQFRTLLEKYSQVSEVAARARTYLAVADARLRTESILPRDADSLYDRGVIELNRGEYVAAQEMFERALKREPEAAHIHYGLAATRARLGSVDLALQSLQKALDLQPTLRVRAQHDHDLTALRNDPDFDKLVFQPRL